jgi:hypothetical protein
MTVASTATLTYHGAAATYFSDANTY